MPKPDLDLTGWPSSTQTPGHVFYVVAPGNTRPESVPRGYLLEHVIAWEDGDRSTTPVLLDDGRPALRDGWSIVEEREARAQHSHLFGPGDVPARAGAAQ